MAGTLDGLFGGIKSIQRGATTMTSGTTSLNVAITAVDMSKTIVLVSSTTPNSSQAYEAAITLSSSTQIQLKQGGSVSSCVVYWQVVESN